MNRSLFFTSIFLALFLTGGVILILFWQIGIFKKELPPSPQVEEIKNQLDFINNYPFNVASEFLKNLSVTKIEIPQISPDELGRENLF